MAAAVIKNPLPQEAASLGTLRARAFDLVLSATAYATGGFSVPKSNIFLNEIYFNIVTDITNGPTGYEAVYNQTTNKLQLFTSNGAAPAALAELANATAVTGTFRVVCFGV